MGRFNERCGDEAAFGDYPVALKPWLIPHFPKSGKCGPPAAPLVVALNFTPVPRRGYRVGVPFFSIALASDVCASRTNFHHELPLLSRCFRLPQAPVNKMELDFSCRQRAKAEVVFGSSASQSSRGLNVLA